MFCKIIAGKIPSSKIYEDEWVLGIEDINPLAPIHCLVLPKKHVRCLNDLKLDNGNGADATLLAKMLAGIQQIAADKGVRSKGYRTIINTEKEGGQTVFHLHAHILAGEQLGVDIRP